MYHEGIDYYDKRPVETEPVLSEILAAMTNEQKIGILDAYAHRPRPLTTLKVAHTMGIDPAVTSFLYSKIEMIEQGMKQVMTGEDPPKTAVQLRNYLQNNYGSENNGDPDSFNNAQVEAIAIKVIEMSKYDGTGTFTFYKNNVTKLYYNKMSKSIKNFMFFDLKEY